MSTTPVIFNAFNMLTASQNGNGLWRHPEDRRHRFADIDWWFEYVRTIEQAGFSALMFADGFGLGKVSPELDRIQVEEGVYFPAHDPFAYIPALAAVTSRLSFIVTASTSFENPYALARRFASLDHVTRGRIAWNIVTSFSPSMADSYGVSLAGHDERYRRADEFATLVYRLLEGSWRSDAIGDRVERLYHADRIEPVEHAGEFFSSNGTFFVDPSPQRTPVLFQAGLSEQGTRFAAGHAEGILVGGSPEVASRHIARTRELAESLGRASEHLRFLAPILIVTDRNERLAKQRLDGYREVWSTRASYASVAYYSGVDLTRLDPESDFDFAGTERHRAASSGLQEAARQRAKVRAVQEEATKFPGTNALIAGGPEQVADEIERWIEAGISGFNLMDLVIPSDTHNFIEYVLPILRSRGLVSEPSPRQTFREQLFPDVGPLLPEDHPAARYRREQAATS